MLQPVIQPYAWGSRHGIAELQGRPVPSPGPEAELWMGAHPSAPAGAAGTTLDAAIAADPDRELGPRAWPGSAPGCRSCSRCCPPTRRCRSSCTPPAPRPRPASAPRTRACPRDPARNYVDDWPKPELLCALTPFEVLAGLRAPRDAAALLRALDVAQLAPLAAELDAATSPQALADALAAILAGRTREALVGAVVAACAALAASGGPYAAACAAAVREAGHHPGDLGLVAMLLMRHVLLAPGQAVFMPAGGLHAYLRGTGIEVLANSDNVVRAGLTSKHVDVPELLKLLDPAVTVPVLSPAPLGDGVTWFDTPAPEFRLYVADLAEPVITLPAAGPRIALCTDRLRHPAHRPGETVKLPRGESCFIPAADGPLHASAAGPARLFLAAPGPLGENSRLSLMPSAGEQRCVPEVSDTAT